VNTDRRPQPSACRAAISCLRPRTLASVAEPRNNVQTTRMSRNRAPGYVLSTDGVTVDLAEHRILVKHADRALTEGQFASASRDLGSALALWRGPAFAGLISPAFQAMAAALERGRLLAIERKAECDLLLGRYDLVANELSPVLAAHPLSEFARAELMLAMYQLGSRPRHLSCTGQAARPCATRWASSQAGYCGDCTT